MGLASGWHRRGDRGRRGMTMPELLLSLGLGVLILGVTTALFVYAERLYRKGDRALTAQQRVLVLLDRLAQDMRQVRVLLPTPGTEGSVLEYYAPQLVSGRYPVVDRADQVVFDETIKYQLAMNAARGQLMKVRYRNTAAPGDPPNWVYQGEDRLADLGSQGAARFARSAPERKTLTMWVTGSGDGAAAGRPFTAATRTYLWNQREGP